MHGQTCSRTRIIGRLDCSTNKAPDMHWESSLGPLVASQQSLKAWSVTGGHRADMQRGTGVVSQ